jgi:hypothetical protein
MHDTSAFWQVNIHCFLIYPGPPHNEAWTDSGLHTCAAVYEAKSEPFLEGIALDKG